MEYLTEEEITKLVSVKDIVSTIENYYLNDGDKKSLLPERLFINDDDNTAIMMPSFYENYYGAKVVGIAPGNAKLNEPTLRGLFILYDRETMNPLITMDARTITAMRTGAISGVGTKYLAHENSETVGIIGTGDQGWSHFQATCAVRPIKKALIYNRSERRQNDFIDKVKKHHPQMEIEVAEPERLVEESDVICLTTTSKNPVIPELDNMNLSHKHFSGSGAFKSSMQEISTSIIKKINYISVDSYDAFSESGEMSVASNLGYSENNIADLKQIVKNGKSKEIQEQSTIFKSVGISIFDTLAAILVYEKLKK